MRGLAILFMVMGTGLCVLSPMVPTVRFQAKRQNNPMLGNSIQEFALDLSSELPVKETVVVSPLSISSLMLVLMLGASGNSYQQLYNALYLPPNESSLHRNFGELLQSITNPNQNATLKVANGLFLQEGVDVLVNFTDNARRFYMGSIQGLPFSGKPNVAKDFINNWVKQRTQGKIQELLTHPLSRNTIFAAANTVYFNGAWANPFNPQFTNIGQFNTGSTIVELPMMRSDMNVPYINIPDLDAHMISLPYEGNQFAMFILMPKGNVTNSLEELEFKLDSGVISQLISNMTEIDITVSLPKMRLNYKTNLRRVLEALDVGSIFRPRVADFSRLTVSEDVWVDDMVHETVVEVSETGTVAAASTAFSLNRIGNSRSFSVNRPAILFIRHLASGLPIIWGRLLKPEPLGRV